MSPKQDWNWGQKLDDFPTGMFDDFDGEIDVIEYEMSSSEDFESKAQIFLLVMPAEYEWEARELKLPEEGEDTGLPRGWYGLGGKEDTYRISNDGFEITGPSPVRNTRGVKLMSSIISATGLKMTSTSLKEFQGLNAHWKITTEKGVNKETKVSWESFRVYATGKPLGYAAMSEESRERGSSRRGRRGKKDDSEEPSESEAPARVSRRRGATRASTEETSEATESTESKSSSNGMDEDATRELAYAEIVKLVAETGEAGLKRTLLPTVAMQLDGDIPEEVFTMISKRGTVNAAIEAGKIVNDEGVLRLPDKAE